MAAEPRPAHDLDLSSLASTPSGGRGEPCVPISLHRSPCFDSQGHLRYKFELRRHGDREQSPGFGL